MANVVVVLMQYEEQTTAISRSAAKNFAGTWKADSDNGTRQPIEPKSQRTAGKSHIDIVDLYGDAIHFKVNNE